ncbi:MAG: two-component system chemotaxis response regulator CheY [Oleiphilaceae bacterium]|jgi:two-component system chemotaxis response regulator CheY
MQIIVVDDDAVSRFALVDLMQVMGFADILQFHDGQQAWDFLQSNPMPVLCCCDVRMPNMSGIELLEKIRMDTVLSNLNFVLITSGSDRDTVQKAIMLNVGGYIVKPFNSDGATEKIKEILSKYWKNIAEDPRATAKRLSIPADKLKTYFGAFNAQLENFMADVGSTDASSVEAINHNEKIDAMQTGCLTLGLWHSAKELEKLKNREDKCECLIAYLKTVVSAVDYQIRQL